MHMVSKAPVFCAGFVVVDAVASRLFAVSRLYYWPRY